MSAYWVAHVNIKNKEKFTEYMSLAFKIVDKYHGKILVCGGTSESLEGHQFQQHVIIEFENLHAARTCYFSQDYQQAKAVRENAAEVMVTLLESL